MKEGLHLEEPPVDQRSEQERRIDDLIDRYRATADQRSPKEQAEIEADLMAARGLKRPIDVYIDDMLDKSRATAHLRTEVEQLEVEAKLEEARNRVSLDKRTPEEEAESERRLDAIGAEHGRRERATEWRTEDNTFEDPIRFAVEAHEGRLQDLRMWAMPTDRETWGTITYLTEPHRGDQGIGYVRRVIDVEDLLAQLDQANKADAGTLPDIIMLMPRDRAADPIGFNPRGQADLLRAITKIRNNPNLRNQPFIIGTGYDHKGSSTREQLLDAGADLYLPVFGYAPVLERKFRSIPDLLNAVEDTYGARTSQGKRNFYTEYRNKLEDRSKITADTEHELEILDEIFQKHQVHDVLDAGCGNGRIALPLAERGLQVTGLDATEDLVKDAQHKAEADGFSGRAKFLSADLRSLPIKAKSQDAIMYNWHVFCDLLGNKSKALVLGEAYRTLREDGVLVLDIPDREQLSDERDGVYLNNPGGEHIYIGYVPSIEEMQTHLERAGFKNVEVKKWQTAQGFPKLTFVAEKSLPKKP
ncbi:MAG: class I SAM-dependent methyltransferase [Patescibacteria group bacterium]|jgi:ubiquinone/menaquinone biosynthesis C-methylase UbiE